MEINDIFKLIDAGFTKEDIIEMSKPVETVAGVSQVETETITPEEPHYENMD